MSGADAGCDVAVEAEYAVWCGVEGAEVSVCGVFDCAGVGV